MSSDSSERFDSSNELRKATGAASEQWILRALGDLSNDIREFRTEVREEAKDFRKEVKDANTATDGRFRNLENKAAYLIGGIAVALAFATFMGWILAPVVRVLVQNTIGT